MLISSTLRMSDLAVLASGSWPPRWPQPTTAQAARTSGSRELLDIFDRIIIQGSRGLVNHNPKRKRGNTDRANNFTITRDLLAGPAGTEFDINDQPLLIARIV